MQALIQRSGVDPALIDDVIWGCNYQRTYLENNLARVAAIKAGLPDTVPGITVHRNCTSSMSVSYTHLDVYKRQTQKSPE